MRRKYEQEEEQGLQPVDLQQQQQQHYPPPMCHPTPATQASGNQYPPQTYANQMYRSQPPPNSFHGDMPPMQPMFDGGMGAQVPGQVGYM